MDLIYILISARHIRRGHIEARDSDLYNVIVSGGISKGCEVEAARENFARLFKTDKSAIEQYFTGKPGVLKKGLTREAAEKYKEAVFSTGVICYIMPANAGSVHAPVTQQSEKLKPARQSPSGYQSETDAVKAESAGEDPWYDDKWDSPSAKTFDEEFPDISTQMPTKMPERDTTPVDTFFNHIRGTFSYPLAGGGKWMIMSCSLFFTIVSHLISYIPFIDILAIVTAGYMCAYMMKILDSSSMGERTLTDWPDFDDLGDIVRPFGMFISVIFVSLLPLIVYFYFVVPPDGAISIFEFIIYGHETMSVPVYVLLLLAGVCYAPMALMAVALFNPSMRYTTLTGLNPVLVIQSMLRIPLEYFTACGVIVLSYIVTAIMVEILDILYVPIAGDILGKSIMIYVLFLEVRILGLLYYTNKDRLEWEIV